ncbi:MAG: diacylglycerol kinase family protein [Candidatus Limnocylindrales bacterium]
MRDLMRDHGLGDELVPTSSEDNARTAVQDAIQGGYDVVVAAGGDGSAGLIADELIGTEVALGILPLGSVMNVARSLGVPRDLAGAADVLAGGVVRTVDVGLVGERHFYEAGSVGMNAAIFREAQRFDAGDWGSILRTVWVALRYRPARMELRLDEGVVRTRALMVTISNGPYTGVAMMVAPDARLDDGLFDVIGLPWLLQVGADPPSRRDRVRAAALLAACLGLSIEPRARHERPPAPLPGRFARPRHDPGRIRGAAAGTPGGRARAPRTDRSQLIR